MLIRSQNKRELFNLDNIMTLSVGKTYGQGDAKWLIEADRQSLGEYSTEAKAIKVLDMIQKEYEGCTRMLMHADMSMETVFMNRVFQMLADEELDEPTVQDIIDDIMKM